MTDLVAYTIMLSKGDESFVKRQSGEDWVVELPTHSVEMHFHKDGSYWFTYNTRTENQNQID